MRIYIAGPMSGIPHFNYPLFNAVAAKLREQGHSVFNPAERDIERHNGTDISADNATGDVAQATANHGFSMRQAFADDMDYICLEADAICLLPGWEKSEGAFAEWATARRLKHTMIYWSE